MDTAASGGGADGSHAAVVLPDVVTRPTQLHGAALLWFDDPILLPSPAPVLAPGAFDVLDLVQRRQPPWGPQLLGLWRLWRRKVAAADTIRHRLEPLEGMAFRWSVTAHRGGSADVDRGAAVIEAAQLGVCDLAGRIPLDTVAQETVRHIFLGSYHELGGDLERLYARVESLFSTEPLEHALVRMALPGVLALDDLAATDVAVMVDEPLLVDLLCALPVSAGGDDPAVPRQAVAWRIFAATLADLRVLHPANVEEVVAIRGGRGDALRELRHACRRAADVVTGGRSARPSPSAGQVRTVLDAVRAPLADVRDASDPARLDDAAEAVASWLTATGDTLWAAGLAAAAIAQFGADDAISRLRRGETLDAPRPRDVWLVGGEPGGRGAVSAG